MNSGSEIWNWPTNKDWVHVEGNWIFDKGHPPANTEIHPPQFVGIKRYLPEKYVVGTGNFAFSTRCDIFANGDGSAMWNNKGHDSFARHVRMSQRVFIVTFTHDLPRPNANAHLTFGWKVQKGDSYTGHPTVTVFENGTADIPQPHVMFILPWANDHVPDNAVFARTLFLYWDDLPQHGVPINYPMRVLNVQIDSVIVLDKKEGGDSDAGEYILFANLGNRWWFLNEFVGVNDIISDGLGTVWDPFYSARHPISTGNGTRPFPQPSDAKFIFSFDLFCEVCLPPGKEFRMSVSGWERDYIDGQFGRILDQYMSCEDARHTLESQFNGDYISQGGLDDPVGTADVVVHYSDQWQPQYSVFSRGSMQHGEDSHIGNTNPNRAFQAKYRVKR